MEPFSIAVDAAGRAADEGVERSPARRRDGERRSRATCGVKTESGEYPRAAISARALFLTAGLDVHFRIAVYVVLQDVSVEEAEFRSMYEAGTLAKVSTIANLVPKPIPVPPCYVWGTGIPVLPVTSSDCVPADLDVFFPQLRVEHLKVRLGLPHVTLYVSALYVLVCCIVLSPRAGRQVRQLSSLGDCDAVEVDCAVR